MRTKAILLAIAAVLTVGTAGVWLISEKQAAQDRREKFFGTAKKLPTSGGQQMKPEW